MVINADKVDTSRYVVQAKPATEVYDFWLSNLHTIRELLLHGWKFNNFVSAGTFALSDSISYTLFGKSSRYYFEKRLGIPYSHLLNETFRNGFIHSFSPLVLEYEDSRVGWGYSHDHSSGSPRPFYSGEYDKDTGQEIFAPDIIAEYLEFKNKDKHLSLSFDRLIARIETDIAKRKRTAKPNDRIEQIIGKNIPSKAPTGARKVTKADVI